VRACVVVVVVVVLVLVLVVATSASVLWIELAFSSYYRFQRKTLFTHTHFLTVLLLLIVNT